MLKKDLINYFKTNQIFHNDYINNLEDCIEQNNNLTRQEKDKLIMPLYAFYEFPKKLHKRETIVNGIREVV